MSTNKIMDFVTEYAPLALLIMAALTFVGVGAFQYEYYTEIFTPRLLKWGWVAGVFVASVHQGIRLALLISSMRDFSSGAKTNGALGMLASLGVMIYDFRIAQEIAAAWGNWIVGSILIFMVVMGFVLEMRLILSHQSGE